MIKKDNMPYIDLRNNLKILKVGQTVEITDEDFYALGKIVDIDLEAEGFWLLLETYFEGMEDWRFPNSSFFYAIDINRLRILP